MVKKIFGFVGDQRGDHNFPRQGVLWKMGYFLCACSTIIAGMVLEWVASGSGVGMISWIPFSSFVAIWWVERMSWHLRFLFAFLSGILLDASSGYPLGVHALPLVVLAGIVGFFHAFFSSQESFLVRLGVIVLLCTAFLLLMPLVRDSIRV